MFPSKQRKHMHFRQNAIICAQLAQRLEFNEPFLSLNQFKISSKDVTRKFIFFLFPYAVFIFII